MLFLESDELLLPLLVLLHQGIHHLLQLTTEGGREGGQRCQHEACQSGNLPVLRTSYVATKSHDHSPLAHSSPASALHL
jgi:hypothetical protein